MVSFADIAGAFQSFPQRIQLAIAGAILLAALSIGAVAYTIRGKGGVSRISAALAGRLLGRPEQYSYVLFAGLVVVSIVGIAVSGWLFSRFAHDAEMGSTLIAKVVIGLGTNFTLWAVLTVVATVAVFTRLPTTLSKKTAEQTNLRASEIKHIAAEVKTTDGTSRLIGGPGHSEDQLRAKLLRVFNGADIDEGVEELDTLAPESKLDGAPEDGSAIGTEIAGALPEKDRSDAAEEAEENPEAQPQSQPQTKSGELIAEIEAVDEELEGLYEKAEALEQEVLDAAIDPEKLLEADDTTSMYAVMPDDDQALVDEFEALVEEIETLEHEREALRADLDSVIEDAVAAEQEEAGDEGSAPSTIGAEEANASLGLGDEPGPESEPESGAEPEPQPEPEPEPGREQDTGTDAAGEFQRRMQLLRMDLAAVFNGDEIFTRFVVPAGLTALGSFTVLGTFWVHPLLWALVGFLSLFVGSAVYTGFKWKRRRNVEKARQTSNLGGWSACDVLAKRCATERGTEFYVVWMAGHKYFGYDKHRLARKVANRWHQRLNGQIVAPAIHEHFWSAARSMMPLTNHIETRDSRRGRGAIYDTIADVIRAQDNTIIPKKHLCERVVNRGPDPGHDPDIVGEVYADMVGEALEEFEVELRDTDGNLVPVTLVTLRTAGVPLDMETLRSEFSNQVNPEDDPLYELPDVDGVFDIEDALSVGVPPGVNPDDWDNDQTRTKPEGVRPADAPTAD